MACNCLSNAIQEIKNKYPEWEGKKVRDYVCSEVGIDFRTGHVVYGIGIDVKFENQKKNGHTHIAMAYCPLCGNKME